MAARSLHRLGPLMHVCMWPKIMKIWSDHLTINSGYEGGLEGRSGLASIWTDDFGMMRDIRECQLLGTMTDGFRIWVIIIQYKTINLSMELMPINLKVVAKTIT